MDKSQTISAMKDNIEAKEKMIERVIDENVKLIEEVIAMRRELQKATVKKYYHVGWLPTGERIFCSGRGSHAKEVAGDFIELTGDEFRWVLLEKPLNSLCTHEKCPTSD